jgi:hypothetical protein
MQHYGYQPALGGESFFAARLLRPTERAIGECRPNLRPDKRHPTKAELAQQGAAAFMAWRARKAGRP